VRAVRDLLVHLVEAVDRVAEYAPLYSHVPEYWAWPSKYGTYLVIWYGEFARLFGNRVSGWFPFCPSHDDDT
jgi:hypothetical protein